MWPALGLNFSWVIQPLDSSRWTSVSILASVFVSSAAEELEKLVRLQREIQVALSVHEAQEPGYTKRVLQRVMRWLPRQPILAAKGRACHTQK